LSNAAGAGDRVTLDNKTEAATYYAANVGTGFTRDDAKAVVADVDGTRASVLDSKSATDGGTQDSGSTFTLTAGADDFTGSGSNDTFNAVIDDNTAANNTLTVLDKIDGGNGTDVLNIIADTSAAAIALSTATITNVENIYARNVSGQTLTVDATIPTGEQQLWSDRSTDQVGFDNVAANTTIGVKGDGNTLNGLTTAAFGATVTSAAVAVTGGTTQGNITLTGGGLTSASIATVGTAKNTVGTIDVAAAKEITVGGTADLTATGITTTATAGTLTINGAGALSLGTLDAGIDIVDASVNTGGVTLTLDAGTDTKFTGGTGADSVTTGAVLTTGSVNAGDGTDTLTIAVNGHLTAVTGAKYTNFETLGVADGVTVDLDNIAGITSVSVNDASAGATVVNNLSAVQAGAVTLTDLENAITLNVKGATIVNQLDTLSLTINDGDATLSETVSGLGGVITSAGVETLNIVAVDDALIAAVSNMGALTGVNLSGAGDHSFTTNALTANANTSINAATATGTVVIDASGATANGLAITGSATGVNTLTGSAQADVIVGGAAIDSITGGAGADTMTGGGAADTFVFAANGSLAGTSDKIADFNTGGSDILDFGTGGVVLNLENDGTTATTDVDTTAGGKVVFAAADDTYAEKVTAIQADTQLGAIGSVAFFEDSGNTYVYSAGALIGDSDDQIVELTGVVGLSTITIVGGDLTIA
jgi:hypothetical protein